MLKENINYLLKPATMEHYGFIYHIRKVTLEEYIEKIWGWDEEYQQSDFRECFIPEKNKIIVYDNEEIGYLETSEEDNIVYIVELEILPEYQGKGIGSSIIKDIIEYGGASQKKVNIGCFKINRGAKRLYESLGFKVIEETETHYILEN